MIRLVVALLAGALIAVEPAPVTRAELAPVTKAELARLIDGAQQWILAQQQESGALIPGSTFALGVTALAVVASTETPGLPKDHPALAKAMRFIDSFRQKDGSTYDPQEGLATYGTALTLRALVATGGPPARIQECRDWLFGRQNRDRASPGQGGIGYGDGGAGHEDLSNTGHALLALRESGVPAQDERMQAALKFIERCQDLSSVNQAPWVKNEGGAVYSPLEATGSWQEAGAGRSEKFSASGGMTYTLLSSYLALDLAADDPRVQAAYAWLTRNYTVQANPGLAAGKEKQGLYHSRGMLARTLGLLGTGTVPTAAGERDWRRDLVDVLAKEAIAIRLADGRSGLCWINDAKRWGEGVPHLTTAYVLGALKAVWRRSE